MPQDPAIYFDEHGKPFTPAGLAPPPEKKDTPPPGLLAQLAEKAVDTLPAAGGLVGGVLSAETGPGAILGGATGYAGGLALKNMIRGEAPPVAAQLGDIGKAGVVNAIPTIALRTAPLVRDAATRAWANASGDQTPGVLGRARIILERGLGRPTASNTSILNREAVGTNVPAQPPSGIVTAAGKPLPGTPEYVSPQSEIAGTHAQATNTAGKSSRVDLPMGLSWKVPAMIPSAGTLAQGAYTAAGAAGPIGELLRLALMSQLGRGQ